MSDKDCGPNNNICHRCVLGWLCVQLISNIDAPFTWSRKQLEFQQRVMVTPQKLCYIVSNYPVSLHISLTIEWLLKLIALIFNFNNTSTHTVMSQSMSLLFVELRWGRVHHAVIKASKSCVWKEILLLDQGKFAILCPKNLSSTLKYQTLGLHFMSAVGRTSKFAHTGENKQKD